MVLKTNWENLEKPLSKVVLKVINDELQFKTMTPVQAATIPQILSCKDVVVEAVTGSGKTLAFVVPLIEMMIKRQKESQWKKNEIGGIIISPTRELAEQTSQVIEQFLNQPELSFITHRLLVGGSSVEEDVEHLVKNGAQILVCTVGRLLDLFERSDNNLKLAARVKSLDFLVLDEADRLLDLGFEVPLNTILSYLPRQRRTGLFSATQTKELLNLMRAGMRNPVIVSVKEKGNQSTPKLLQNYYMTVDPELKLVCLLNFIESQDIQKAMLFFPTCACVEYWSEILPSLLPQTPILAIHGKMKKNRGKILNKFRGLDRVLLLCTDVMARGVDIPEMDWVLQFDPPSNAAAFVHRVGRTARKGNEGNSLILLLPNELAYIDFLSANQKVSMVQQQVDETWKESLTRVNSIIHKMQQDDKNIFDKGTRAFVSHIKAYSKHECNLILRVKDLDLGRIGTSYGLIRLPRMPEMKDEFQKTFMGPEKVVDINALKYKNKQKQVAYQAKQEVYKETGEWPGKKLNKKKETEAWAEANKKRENRKDNRKKRQDVKKTIQEAKASGADVIKKKRKLKYSRDELEELARENAAFKKFKKHKITKDELDSQIGIDHSDSD